MTLGLILNHSSHVRVDQLSIKSITCHHIKIQTSTNGLLITLQKRRAVPRVRRTETRSG